MEHGGTAVERNCQLVNVLLDCNKNGDVTTGFVTSYRQVRITDIDIAIKNNVYVVLYCLRLNFGPIKWVPKLQKFDDFAEYGYGMP